jgi:hypothetical protein
VEARQDVFSSEAQRECYTNSTDSLYCWQDDELLIISLENNRTHIQKVARVEEELQLVLPLLTDKDLLLVCGLTTCNVSLMINNKLYTLDMPPFAAAVIGGTVHQDTNKLLLVENDAVFIVSYIFFNDIRLRIDESIMFPEGFECY